tara:strand:+ start:48 stop:290 length:243 start_codon:yes stop_codon:yes gene_type:complete
MKKIRLTEKDLKRIVKKVIKEGYSDRDMERGDELKGSVLGIDFPGDFRRKRLAIKKLVRLKQVVSPEHHQSIDNILDLLV